MYPSIIVTVDVVLMTLCLDVLCVALIRRPNAPFAGELALPGGYVHAQEDGNAEDAAYRILREKMGIRPPYLEQLATFSGNRRDPRGWSASIAYFALVSPTTEATWQPVSKLQKLAFDHAAIIQAAVDRLRSKSAYSVLPAYLLPETFTLAELQKIYEQVLGSPLDKSSFRRKIKELDLLDQVAGSFQVGNQRPAQIYRLKKMMTFDRTLSQSAPRKAGRSGQ
ncbi:NUDIX domain-containing protein [Candidatus Accumulibacter vicinus]|uniref:Uncharacterized protein n=1 Tax=Candidatus Accumulibacter vicinus TaxID=2954382 RepID=A0A084Y236_9PROT|nr:NUDIX domain-containing protein [Candidatus Accumulibacter vicinus]KFB68780.1 MAG: hypothetical protein CAPSK01_001634 [Candidatus Accumulibacter vicinus]